MWRKRQAYREHFHRIFFITLLLVLCMETVWLIFKSKRRENSQIAFTDNETSKFLNLKLKSNLTTGSIRQIRLPCWTPKTLGFLDTREGSSCQNWSPCSAGSRVGHHIARWTPDSCPWSAKWRKTIRLSLQRRFTPRGRDVITHRFRILTGQLSRGRAAISPSATS